MTTAEKIRAEIERLKEINKRTLDGQLKVGCLYALNQVLSFLSTLEESNFKDFPTTDEEMAKFLATHPKVKVPEKYKTPDWMFEKSEKPVPKDLEEAAEDFVWEVMENDEDGISDLCRKLRPTSKISDFYDALAEFFIAGAEWMAEQLKK